MSHYRVPCLCSHHIARKRFAYRLDTRWESMIAITLKKGKRWSNNMIDTFMLVNGASSLPSLLIGDTV